MSARTVYQETVNVYAAVVVRNGGPQTGAHSDIVHLNSPSWCWKRVASADLETGHTANLRSCPL